MRFRKLIYLILAGICFFNDFGLAYAQASNTVNNDTENKLLETLLAQNQGKVELPADKSQRSIKWVNVSGQVNLDGIISDRSPALGDRYQGSPSAALNLNTASLYIDTLFNSYIRTHLNLHTQTTAKPNALILQNKTPSLVEEANVTLLTGNNFPVFYTRLGRQYLLFGNYELYHMSPSLNQLLTQMNQTAATIGVISSSDIHSEFFIFNNPINARTYSGVNYGLNLGYQNDKSPLSYQLSVSYLNNMAAVDYINSGLSANTRTSQVPAISLNGRISYQPFALTAGYVTALTHFPLNAVTFEDHGAKPWATDAYVDYFFTSFSHNSALTLGYQLSGQAASVGGTPGALGCPQGMPKRRWVAKYAIQLTNHVQLADELLIDRDYGVNQGGTGGAATTDILRLALSFT